MVLIQFQSPVTPATALTREEVTKAGEHSSSTPFDSKLLPAYKAPYTKSHQCSKLCRQPFNVSANTEHLLWPALYAKDRVTKKKILPALAPI